MKKRFVLGYFLFYRLRTKQLKSVQLLFIQHKKLFIQHKKLFKSRFLFEKYLLLNSACLFSLAGVASDAQEKGKRKWGFLLKL
jgi:hypothetical protein